MKTCEAVGKVQDCIRLVHHFESIINSFVLDFFVDDLWNQIPKSWTHFLDDIPLESLAEWLDASSSSSSFPLCPLGLSALKVVLRTIPLRREYDNVDDDQDESFDRKRKHLWHKNVTLKKKHELPRISGVVREFASLTGCRNVVDIGSGIGHLSRRLRFGRNGLNVLGIEAQETLTEAARKTDLVWKNDHESDLSLYRDTHTVDSDLSSVQSVISQRFDVYGLVGLHACGDLSSHVLRLFKETPQASFVCLMCCCYMKTTTSFSFLSEYVRHRSKPLSYEARELSCHALEAYVSKLRRKESDSLKVHCYRAVLESVLNEIHPDLRHSRLRTVSNSHLLSFSEYAIRAVTKDDVDPSRFETPNVQNMLNQWKRVVTFYILRLALAPVVETLLLLDRFLYLTENADNNITTCLVPIFDPEISPRNLALLAYKRTT